MKNRAAYLVASGSLFVLAACGRGHAPSVPQGTIVARAVDSPAGGFNRGVLRCDRGGGCQPVAAGDTIGWDTQIKTTRGAHGTFELDDGTLVDLGDEAAIGLASGDGGRSIQVDRGTATIDTAATHAGTETLRVRLVDRIAELDASSPTSLSARASAADRATITVRRGTVTLRGDSGETTKLGAGQTLAIALGEPIDERATWSAAAVDAAIVAKPAETPPVETKPAEPSREDPGRPLTIPARGLGAMTARVPGTSEVVSGVRLVTHKAEVTIKDGFSRTEVEEEFRNDTGRVLEGRYAFPLPPDATIARLALWVGTTLVEGEIVERDRAARIFKAIVDDSVRPRDPALLEWVSGSEFALKVFPIPAHGSRKVVIAYDESLSTAGGRARYVYPLSLGTDRAVTVDDFSVHVSAIDSAARLGDVETARYAATISARDRAIDVTFAAKSFTPENDFVVSYARDEDFGAVRGKVAHASAYVPLEKEFVAAADKPADKPDAFTAIRMTVDLPDGAPLPARLKRDRVIAIDSSFSESPEALAGEVALAMGLIRDLDPTERFAVLACDSACASYPEDGLVAADPIAIDAAERWLADRSSTGSSNLAGALLDAARRVEPTGAGQLVIIGDGAPSAGELSADSIASRARSAVYDKKADLRLLGAGRSVDEVVMKGLARSLGGAYTRVATGEALSQRIATIATDLRRPVLRDVSVDVPGSIHDVYPRAFANVRVGDEVLVVGKLARTEPNATMTLHATLDGKPYSLVRKMTFGGETAADNPLVPRLWAQARIADLETSDARDAKDEAIALSKRYHVMSRYTSLLVLENDSMFAEFGVKRTTRKADDQSDQKFLARNDPPVRDAAEYGMLGLLNTGSTPTSSSWGTDEHLSAKGNMWGQETGDAFGSGGLGLSGIGEGGSGKGDGIGLGNAGTVGHGAGTGEGEGFGNGHGRLGGSHRANGPTVRMGASTVSGRLPPEVIQRIVRQQFGRMRLCYENGLRNDPSLGGRIAVRFVINGAGEVASAQNGGSSLTDTGVIACVVRAFIGLTFPAPEGGNVTVTYPITFSPADGSAPPVPVKMTRDGWGSIPVVPDWVKPAPTASHQKGDMAWTSDGESAIAKLRADMTASPESRSKRDALVRGLLVHGRFVEALDEARRFAAIDPDLPAARELLAYAEAASGDGKASVLAVDALVETSPTNAAAHTRAARAFEAAGDEKRACAHWRSLAELTPSADEPRAEAIRCRARAESDRDGALAEARSIDKAGDLVKKITATLESSAAPAHESTASAAGQFEATMACAAGVEGCPTVVVVTPNGNVISPWTPSSARSSHAGVSFSSLRSGTYRTLVVGGAPDAKGDVTVRTLGSTRKFAVDHGGLQTVAATIVSGI